MITFDPHVQTMFLGFLSFCRKELIFHQSENEDVRAT